jgi:hypothetical protein
VLEKRLTRLEGSPVLRVTQPSLRTRKRVRVHEARTVREPKAWKEKASKGKNPGEHRAAAEGQPEVASNGFTRGGKLRSR